MEITNVFQNFVADIGAILNDAIFPIISILGSLIGLGMLIGYIYNWIGGRRYNVKWKVKSIPTYKHKIPKDSAF